jgi:hypothetical protein
MSTPASSPKPQYNRTTSASEIQHAVDTAVSRLLSNVLTVAMLTVGRDVSPRTSPASSSLPSLLSRTLPESTARRTGKELGMFLTRIASELSEQRTEEYEGLQEEFSEELRENLLQLEVFKDDIVSDLCDIGADSLGAFKQDCQDHAELVSSDFTDMFSQVIDVAMAKIDTYKAQNVEPVSEQELFARQQQLLAVDQAILDRKCELFDLETKARERLLAADRTVLERNRELFELQMKVREVQGKVDGVGGTETETAKRGERVGSAPA